MRVPRSRRPRSPLRDPWVATATAVAVALVFLVVVLFLSVLVTAPWTVPAELAAGRTWA